MNKNRIVVINGSNLNMLGTREPGMYGSTSLSAIVDALKQRCQEHGLVLQDFQSNHEGALVDYIHALFAEKDRIRGIILNPGSLTHSSVSLRDALLAVSIPVVEVHLTNIYTRVKTEPFRLVSYISDIASGVIIGMGTFGYHAALEFFLSEKH